MTSFISSIAYRAWGAPKGVTYGNSVTESYQYNSRLQPTSYTLGNVSYTNTNVSPNTSSTSMSWTYDFYDDGRAHHAYDSNWNFWDRSYSYDHAGRLAEADTNRVAHGQSWDFYHPDPYKQTSTYDVWNNLKLTGYAYNNQQSDSSTYTNNRRSDAGYDADGNVTTNPSYQNTVDVAAKNVHAASLAQVGDGSTQWPRQPASDIAQTYDADGRPTKRTQITRQNSYDPDTGEFFAVDQDTLTSHYIYSTVLGAQVVDLDQYGQANVWVYAGGQRIATAIAGSYGNTTFEHHNPVTFSRVTTNAHSSSRAAARDERDPQTAPVALTNPGGTFVSGSKWNEPLAFIGGDPSDFVPGVTLDGMPMTRADYNRTTGTNMGMMIFDVYVGRIPPGKDIPRHLPAYYAGSFALLLPDFPQNPLEPLLQQGKDELKKRISERKPCADVFGGKDKALKALSQLKFSPGTLETGIMQINGNNVTVDQNPFNKSGRTLPLALNIRTSAVPGGTSTKYDLMALHLTGKEFAAFAVGHELGHKRKVYGEYDNDGESPFSNLAEGANNEKIRAACFGEFAPQSPPTR